MKIKGGYQILDFGLIELSTAYVEENGMCLFLTSGEIYDYMMNLWLHPELEPKPIIIKAHIKITDEDEGVVVYDHSVVKQSSRYDYNFQNGNIRYDSASGNKLIEKQSSQDYVFMNFES